MCVCVCLCVCVCVCVRACVRSCVRVHAGTLKWESLRLMLLRIGEPLTDPELVKCLQSLTADTLNGREDFSGLGVLVLCILFIGIRVIAARGGC